MPQRLALLATLLALAPVVRGDDALPAEVGGAVKSATLFVRAEGDGWGATGTGFVVFADDKAVFVATNHHVATPSPPPDARGRKAVALSVVFDSGTKSERAYPAAVVGSDPERDLAVLRVEGVKTPPKPLAYADPKKVVETATVYSFGFPFGKALSSDKGFPAVTVGKASVSSMRNGPDGELAAIQIDGNLNPGNSGGPVVDAAGKLVGVAQSIVKEGKGIGFIVPAGELTRMMDGRVGNPRLLPPKTTDGKTTTRVELKVIDPVGNLKAVSVRYLFVPAKGKRPKGESLAKNPDAKTVNLNVADGVAAADLPVASADGEVLVQVAVEPKGKALAFGRVQPLSLALAALGGDLSAPPSGWVEVAPAFRDFVMWVPEKSKPASSTRTLLVDGRFVTLTTLGGAMADGLTYEGMTITFSRPLAWGAEGKTADGVLAAVANELKGKVTDTKEVKMSGGLAGVEGTIEAGKTTARVRVFAFGIQVRVMQVTGTAEQVATVDAETLLAGFRMPPRDLQAPPPAPPAPPPGPAVAPGKEATILGGVFDPVFADSAPDGAILIGLEMGMGDWFGKPAPRAFRPIYRVGEREVFGEQRGTKPKDAVTLKAKAGYAVGGISATVGLCCDGLVLTYMKVKDGGKLDPKDSYDSEPAGGYDKNSANKLIGDGSPVVGVVGKMNEHEKTVTGFGLWFKGQDSPKKGPAVGGPPQAPTGKETTIVAGAFDPTFSEAAPDGALLVGLEVSTTPWFNHPMTRSFRAIYRKGDKESFGEQWGTPSKTVVTLKAKPGYAVGAMSAMSGLCFDGLSVTFMKVTEGGKLDPKDSYDSDYVGCDEKKPLAKFGGDGTPVVGLVGKRNEHEKTVTGFGLWFKGQDPPPKK